MLGARPRPGRRPGYRAPIDADAHEQLRRRPTPERRVEGRAVLARVHEDAALVLAPTAAAVWEDLATWRTLDDLVSGLGERWPRVGEAERRATAAEVTALLDDEGLLDRRRP